MTRLVEVCTTYKRVQRATWFALGLVGLCGCHFDSVGRDAECERLLEDLSACVQVELLPADCSVIAQDDVRALSAAVEGVGCELILDALPSDGDLRSSSCRLYGQGCARSVQQEGFRPARYPFVLVNGIDVSPLFRWSERIQSEMESSGQQVYLGTLPPYSSVSTRARRLLEIVDETLAKSGAEKVHLLCHSFGGLDCRYLVSPGGLGADLDDRTAEDIASRVASVTTVATAHRGTPVADGVLGFLPGVSERDAARALATWIGDWFGPARLEQDAELRASLTALTESQSRAFNASVINAPGVLYQSWAGFAAPYGDDAFDLDSLRAACTPDADTTLFAWDGSMDYLATPLVPLFDLASDEGTRPSDGLCPVDSARWGVFRGCVPADHMEQLGQLRLPDVNVRTGFDIARFYADLAMDLAEQGL